MEPSWIRDGTRVSYIGRWILYRGATREALRAETFLLILVFRFSAYRDKWTFILPALHSPSLILLCITPTSGFMRASGQFNSVQLLSCVQLFATPWTAACQTSLSITNSRSLLKLMSIESVMLSSHLILCRPLLLPPSIFPSIRVFSNWVSSLYQVVRVLEFQLQHQSFQWIFRTDFL